MGYCCVTGRGKGLCILLYSKCFICFAYLSRMPRVCDFCQNSDAILFCRADSAFLCSACDLKVHQANKVASRHERVRICDGCELVLADFTCKADIAVLCAACTVKVHSANTHAAQHEQNPLIPGIVTSYMAQNDIEDFLHVQEMGFNQHTQNAIHNEFADSLHVQDMGFIECAHTTAYSNIVDNFHVPEMGIIPFEYDDGVVDDELYASWLVQHDPKLCDSSKDDEDNASMESKTGLMGWEDHLIERGMLSEPCEENVCLHVEDSLVPSLVHTSSVASNVFQTDTQWIDSQSRFRTSTMGMLIVPDAALNCMSATETLCLHYMGDLCNSIAREARVLRYKEKRKNRNFEKVVRYASRKAYAEARPRVNGRFAKHAYEGSK